MCIRDRESTGSYVSSPLAKFALVDSDKDILSFNIEVSSFLSDAFSISKTVYQAMNKK